MLKATLLFLMLSISILTIGQSNIEEWDNAWKNRTKGKVKKIVVGNRSNGFATFYFKSDKSVFSVEKREQYKINKRTDSSSSFSANFKNDTLFRMVIRRMVPLVEKGRVVMYKGRAVMYLDGNKVLAQDVTGKVYIPEISEMIEKAYEMLLKAKELIKKR